MPADPRARVAVTAIDLSQVTGARIEIQYMKNRRLGLVLALGTHSQLAEMQSIGDRGSRETVEASRVICGILDELHARQPGLRVWQARNRLGAWIAAVVGIALMLLPLRYLITVLRYPGAAAFNLVIAVVPMVVGLLMFVVAAPWKPVPSGTAAEAARRIRDVAS